MEKQLHIGMIEGGIPGIIKIENVGVNYFHCTKPRGGLWTSTYHPAPARYASDWVEWCATNEPSWLGGSRYLIEISSDAKIYIIDNLDDLKALTIRFQAFHNTLNPSSRLNWKKIAKEYDGIHLTEKGETDTRYSIPSLHGWDVESTVWLHNVFSSVELYRDDIVRRPMLIEMLAEVK